MLIHVTDVSTAGFAAAVLERSYEVPVVVDFWAAWCGPCKVLGPTLERLAEEAAGTWELAKVDVDSNQQLAMQFGVQGIPTVIAFKDGEPVNRFTGALPEAQVRDFVSGLAPSEMDLASERAHQALELGDEDGAEAIWRAVLEIDPAHVQAGVGLAALLTDRGDVDGAVDILSRLAPTDAVRRMQAAARLSRAGDIEEVASAAAGGDANAVMDYGRALAATGRYEEALDQLLDVVGRREENTSEEARTTVLDLFELLGSDNPITMTYRRRLASALF